MNSIFPSGGRQDWLLVTINQRRRGRMATWLTTESDSVHSLRKKDNDNDIKTQSKQAF